MRGEGNWSIIIEARWCRLLGNRNNTGRLPQHRHSVLTQAQVKEVLQNTTQLTGTGLQNPGTNTIRACSLALVESLQLPLNLP